MDDVSSSGARGLSNGEWLEADGWGGFASGTASGIRSRRYHGLLSAATTPPTGRVMLVNGVEVEVDVGHGRRALSSHRYAPGLVHPDGYSRIAAFHADPLPTWTYSVDGVEVQFSLAVIAGAPVVTLVWKLDRPVPGARLFVRPLLSCRSIHSLQRERGDFGFEADVDGRRVSWKPLPDMPRIVVQSGAEYRHEPLWYRNFLYEEERARGYDHIEDLASPGTFEFDLSAGDAGMTFQAEGANLPGLEYVDERSDELARDLLARERASRVRRSPLDRAADAYVVRRGNGRTIVAGYPWFGDWGRDTFIAMRGLCTARRDLDVAGSILATWSGLVSEGMLPNRFAESGEEPEYNSVDASLWYIVAVGEYLEASTSAKRPVAASERRLLESAVVAILEGYAKGTRFGIRLDSDGLLAAGEPGSQLTWMDARVDGHSITPRVGKPVEIQALWAAALVVGSRLESRWKSHLERVCLAFPKKFWNEERGHLNDVVDVDHVAGAVDDTLRPNQILAVGGLTLMLLEGARARRVVDVVEERLVTPYGLRTLPVDHRDFAAVYYGDVRARDRAYHQGTVWPWLIGPFVEAWIRVRGSDRAAKKAARERFLQPLMKQLELAGNHHLCEITDAMEPFQPRGCPFQAWSLGEVLRLDRSVLALESERAQHVQTARYS